MILKHPSNTQMPNRCYNIRPAHNGMILGVTDLREDVGDRDESREEVFEMRHPSRVDRIDSIVQCLNAALRDMGVSRFIEVSEKTNYLSPAEGGSDESPRL